MIIQCEKCKRKFKIDDSKIASPGSRVRCSECGHVAFIEKRDMSAGEETDGNSTEGFTVTEYKDEANSGVGIEDEGAEMQPPAHSGPGDSEGTEGMEITGEEDTETVQGFEFKYPLDNKDVSGTNGEDALNGRAGENEHELESEKLTGGEGNWEDFVSISKTERDTDDFKIKDSRDLRRQESDFSWESLRINDEQAEDSRRVPKMFEDEGLESDELSIIRNEGIPEQAEARAKEPAYTRNTPERLSVDTDVLITNPHAVKSTGGSQRSPYYDSFKIHPTRQKSNGGIFSRVAHGALTVTVFAVIIAASYIILSNTGIIPKQSAQKIERAVESVIPVSITEPLKKDVIITEHRGKWLDTRNGPMYIISGTVTNESDRPVSYIKIKSEFVSEGQSVYEDEVYAGNTFTENELKASPLSDTLLKLKKKSGNIDFYNPEKLAGLNSDIQPGESIPFYAVFPAAGRMLGLKYNLEVVDYEESP